MFCFFSYHHLPIYYTDSKNNALSMSIMSFFRSRSRVFLFDPCLHFLFALVYFQACLFSLFFLLLVLCIVYILFSILFCFVSSIQYLFFPVLIHYNYVFFPAITYQHIILCISSFELCVVYLFHCLPTLLSLISLVLSFLLFLPLFSCILCFCDGFRCCLFSFFHHQLVFSNFFSFFPMF